MAKILIHKIFANPEQPRRDFEPVELGILADSIREHGVINPISVEGPLEGDVYILIDGERRWRAAKLAGLSEIEASVRPAMNGEGPRERLTMAMIANLQRADMNPIDEANGYQKMRELGYSIAEIAAQVGCHTSNINCKLGLLTLPDEVQQLFAQHRLPISTQVTASLMSVPEEKRVSTAVSLANHNATIKTVINICRRVANSAAGPDRRIERGRNPMTVMAEKQNSWNMVRQARIEVSGDLRAAAEATCQNCILFQDASEKVCRDCPAVDLLRRLVG